jgi:hypothetical protein
METMRQQVEEIKGEQFALYDYFSGKFKLVKRNQSFNIKLARMGYGLQYVIPIKIILQLLDWLINTMHL